jgi:hypothetical protein
MKSLHTFAALFATKLYGTGFYDVVKDSGLMTCTDVTDARESIAYILGNAKSAEAANLLLATIQGAPYSAATYMRSARIAATAYSGFAGVRDCLCRLQEAQNTLAPARRLADERETLDDELDALEIALVERMAD